MGGGSLSAGAAISVFSVDEWRTRQGSLTTDGDSTSETSEISVKSGKSSFFVKVRSRANAITGGGGRGLLGMAGGGGGGSN